MPVRLPSKDERRARKGLVPGRVRSDNRPAQTPPTRDGNHLQREWVMRERIRLDDEAQQVRTRRGSSDTTESIGTTAAALDIARLAQEPGRGGVPALGRALDGLHASVGNGAIARLLEGGATRRHRDGQAQARAARTSTASPVVQTEISDETATGDAVGATDSGSSALATGAPAHGPSWTHVGPPTSSTYNVSGSLRDAANAVAGRTEAGSVTATPSSDTETWTPDDGSETISAARVTVAQVVELPTWTDKSSATTNQQAEWDRFHAAITTHEAGHVSTDKTSFAGAHSTMVGQSPTDGDAKLDAATAKAKTDNETYDTTTSHGLTQGTGINPNIDEVTKVP